MSTFIDNQNWRYATKKFDATKKVSDTDLAILKEAIQLTASSYGLQPYKVLIIENPEIRKQLQAASWGQTQIVDASHLLVFVNHTNIDETYIAKFVDHIAETRGIQTEALKGYQDVMNANVAGLPADVKNTWASKQTYIALGNLLAAAAELKIDVTPMEGFVPAEYNKILGLTEKGLNASLVATIGYRHEEDATQHFKKVRKPLEKLFETI
ncbi:NAD(P)H-dependent oxidoreductase [Flavobacterium sp. NRK F10]|uniref:NAD(P)H-dependent oxidoreductase n=1 Tax=Flavobacterium sediminis TaxID=2201181 RepID=A0A2U8QXF5_9FLAO|nr:MULTISPECIES: NAD(P)H-dependent oxidoreductase [Flavobacterium]AWM14833.1 NAD(P)H-dependent oxidoreductase [Flavobacterium sediminis]MCO6176075.1 NAD(P)H-dependent oxidoreductase [Flavobacterium sp. NRK F10]